MLAPGTLKGADRWKRIYQIAVLLGRNPNVAIAPFAQFAKLLYFWVLMLDVILDRQTSGIVDTHVGT